MKYDELLEIVKKLPFDSPKTIYQNDDNELFILRPSKVSNNFKHYDINKNFQIFLKESGSSAFRPNHLRILISLNLWKRNNPEIIQDLLLAFDKKGYVEDQTEKVFKFDPKFNFVKLSLVGDFRGESCDKSVKMSEEEKARQIREFLNKRNSQKEVA